MKPFVFRLDSILQLRAREQARALEIFEHARQAHHRAGLDLDDARQDLDRIGQAIAGRRAAGATGNDHVVLLNAAKVWRECCERLAAILETARREMEKQGKLLQVARGKHEAMQKLRDRHRRAHDAAEQRREENAIGDLIMSRHAMGNHGIAFQ